MKLDTVPDLSTFLQWPIEEVARLVRVNGPKVCVFPINGTRRWFMFEHGYRINGDLNNAYVEIVSQVHIDLYKLLFDHGIETLVTPTLGADVLLRGKGYMQYIGKEGLKRLASHPLFVNFYKDYDVRVHFYGEYIRYLKNTPYESVCASFGEITQKTNHHNKRRLFLGVFAADATQSIIEFSAKHYDEHKTLPNKRNLIEMYYGEYIEPADIFIGFDKFSTFDYPLLASGEEALYFTAAPSPYMTSLQLRMILYDYMYMRRMEEPNYELLSNEDIQWFQDFYHRNCKVTFGTGIIKSGIWIPSHIPIHIE